MSFKAKVISLFINLRFQRIRHANNLKKLQAKRWKKLQTTLLQSEYYRKFALKNGSLADYPLMNKQLFMKHFNEINTRSINREQAFEIALKAESSRDFSSMINGVTVGLSSGTSGNRGIFLATEDERAQWVACVLDRVIGFSLKKRSVAFFLRANSNLYDSVKSKVLRFEFFDLLEQVQLQIDRLNKLNPEILVAQPSLLLELAGYKEKGDLLINPEKIISVAEVLTSEDNERLEDSFGQTIHQVYQCTEGMLAATCKCGTLHFNEDFLIIEKKYLDETNTRFHPIITDLIRTTQPVIRYELNDIVHEKQNCPCGSKMMGIAQIEGRSDDVLRFTSKDNKEIKIYPDFFRRAIIVSNASIRDYTLVQINANELQLYLDNDEAIFASAKESIEKMLRSNHIHDVRILRSIRKHQEKGNKLRRIRNDYWKAD